MMQLFKNFPKPLFIIVFISLLLRLFIGGALYQNLGEDGLFLSDSYSFYQTAENLLEGHGFSRESKPPFTPSAYFPPIYPLLIALSLSISSSVVPLILLQIILTACLPFIVWKIASYITEKKSILYAAALLTAFEPLGIFWSVIVLTDTTSVFCFLLATLFFLDTLQKHSIKKAALSGVFLSLSALIRPEAQYIFIVALLFLLLWTILKKISWKQTAAFGFTFLLVFSPWLIRNINQFDSPTGSTTGVRNIYSSLATSVLTYKTGLPHHEIQKSLAIALSKKYGFPEDDIKENPSIGPILAKEGIQILRDNPKETLATVAITEFSFFTQALYTTYLHRYNIIPTFPTDFSPSVVLFKEGPLTLLSKIWATMGPYVFIPIIGRIFWVLLFVTWILGGIFAVQKGGKARIAGIALSALIIIYAGGSLVAGFSDHGRHRYRVNHFIYILGSFGAIEGLRRIRPHMKKLKW